MFLEEQVSKASIANIAEVSRTALLHFIRTRNLAPKASKGRDRRRGPYKDSLAAIWSLPL
jgi:hypothetical protein